MHFENFHLLAGALSNSMNDYLHFATRKAFAFSSLISLFLKLVVCSRYIPFRDCSISALAMTYVVMDTIRARVTGEDEDADASEGEGECVYRRQRRRPTITRVPHCVHFVPSARRADELEQEIAWELGNSPEETI